MALTPPGTLAALQAINERRQADRDAFIEDVEWCITTGCTHIEAVSWRLCVTPAALERRLRRAGRHDLENQLSGRRLRRRESVAS